jgi:4a-hydroxytetrahydrobiopterin dehydratase
MARLEESEIQERLDALEGITKEFQLGDFAGSVDFVNRITAVAEDMNHHPDLSISWNKVGVSITTHSEGGLTASDFELASRIDAAV